MHALLSISIACNVFTNNDLNACDRRSEQAYKQMVLPLLEYCASIWDPHHQSDIQKLEMVQHRAARFVTNKPWTHNNNDSVTKMSYDLKWPSLQSRRKYLRLILLFKIINHLLLIPHHYFPPPAKLNSTRANHPLKFYHYQPSNDTYRFLFLPRTVLDWNKLPISNIHQLSLVDFKSYLTELLFVNL